MDDFEILFEETLRELQPIVSEFNIAMFSRHNKGYARCEVQQLLDGFRGEKERYKMSFDFICDFSKTNKDIKILDVGSLIAILPIMYRKAGLGEVHIIENFSFYGNTLNRLRALLECRYGIKIHDIDASKEFPQLGEKFDIVTLLAVIEHFSSSPQGILMEIRNVMEKEGRFILDTPNVASALKRIAFLIRGIPPHPPLEDFFFSEAPFTGHNREYSPEEVRKVLSFAGFFVEREELFDLGDIKRLKVKARMIQEISRILPGTLRNYIWVVSKL